MSLPGLAAGAAPLFAWACGGWLWGSFLNTLVDRTPRRDGSGPAVRWSAPARSLCLSCGAPVAWRDNIPIVSYLRLRGRCRACGAHIGGRTLAVEIATPVLFAALALGSRSLDWPWRLWAAAALSVAIVAVPTVLERRRQGRVVGMAAALALLAAILAALA